MKWFAAILGVFAVASCNTTPKQAGDATNAACTLVEAFTADTTVESVCASAPVLAELVTAAIAARADAGAARHAEHCKIIPTTTVCATNAETLAGIRAVKASHP